MSSASGLALSVRNATESETFDLNGQNVSTITNNIKSAFAEPLPLREMIRITFVTGAGKQARQKYDEGAARAVTSTLRELGYEEDRAASCVNECAASFKMQHDTGKNLKTVVVFPKIQAPEDGGEEGCATQQTLVPPDCPAGQIARSSPTVFKNMLKAKCPSWSQKKGCFAALEKLKEMVDELDGKLMVGTPLDVAEQDFYDTTTGLDEKIALCKEEIHQQVESAGVTKFEKEILLEHNAERLATLAEEMNAAKGQKLEKLKAMKAKATQRKEMFQDIEPRPPHKLKHEIEIARLWKEAVPLIQLEEKCRGRLASVKETQQLARKEEIMEEIEAYEDASRGWFEDDNSFDARIKAIRVAMTAKLHKNPATRKALGSYAAAAGRASSSTVRKAAPLPTVASPMRKAEKSSPARTDNWVTPGQDNKKNAWGTATKKKKKNKGTGVFAAMMAKDESDSDAEEEHDDFYDEHDNDEAQQEPAATETTPDTSAPSNNQNENSSPNKKKGKKKNKKKGSGKKKKAKADMTEDELLDATAAANLAAKKADEEGQEVSHPAIAFLKNYLIPFILGFIAFIVSLFFGKPKQKKR